MKLITISVPAYNEQESITTLYETIVNVMDSIKDKYTFELLFINDGSKDKTLEIVKQLHKEDNRVGFVDLSRNYGKEIAMAAGFDYAKGDAVITMDADLQHPPELIKEMIELWEYISLIVKLSKYAMESLAIMYHLFEFNNFIGINEGEVKLRRG